MFECFDGVPTHSRFGLISLNSRSPPSNPLPSLTTTMFRPSHARFSTLTRSLATHAATTTSAATKQKLWTRQEVQQIYDSPLLDLVFRAASVHRQHHDPSKIQLCTLMNIKSQYQLECIHCSLTDQRCSWWMFGRL